MKPDSGDFCEPERVWENSKAKVFENPQFSRSAMAVQRRVYFDPKGEPNKVDVMRVTVS